MPYMLLVSLDTTYKSVVKLSIMIVKQLRMLLALWKRLMELATLIRGEG
jgi:hypothetical protein